ncbi:hypothetical protein [Planomonospora sp. ID82291]|uniref:hypothetical protein n=1 Tax=Planomonospora sp. ID82291 TaxID=2738136 RepID=UPI0018C399CA|nr:hypothetical protein [Planomonospora sp. ID82291]MBG0818895.1 hypothetical protein [Planomonospora sp. ID82291]
MTDTPIYDGLVADLAEQRADTQPFPRRPARPDLLVAAAPAPGPAGDWFAPATPARPEPPAPPGLQGLARILYRPAPDTTPAADLSDSHATTAAGANE